MANRRPLVLSSGALVEIPTADTLLTSGGHLDIGVIGIGYGTGAGGVITQATSRTTGVTLNKLCGAITLFTTTTTANLVNSFTVTNSTVAVGDVVVVNVKTATNIYFLTVTTVAAGSFKISIFTPAAATSEAPVLAFAVLKAVSA